MSRFQLAVVAVLLMWLPVLSEARQGNNAPPREVPAVLRSHNLAPKRFMQRFWGREVVLLSGAEWFDLNKTEVTVEMLERYLNTSTVAPMHSQQSVASEVSVDGPVSTQHTASNVILQPFSGTQFMKFEKFLQHAFASNHRLDASMTRPVLALRMDYDFVARSIFEADQQSFPTKLEDLARLSRLLEDVPQPLRPSISRTKTGIWLSEAGPCALFVVRAIPVHHLRCVLTPKYQFSPLT